MLKKLAALLGLIPGALLLLVGGYNAALTLLAQFFSDFIDFSNFSLVYLFTPYTSAGGSGTFLDSIVAGPGASGGSAVRYWTYMIYGLMAAVGYTTIKTCWGIITERSN
ncbi:unannotated protein [freshwater metagenome]|uniref:Unannotated protein n=1 Tax=freshwater metagenome TaxID=449393 RepID=A0A6J6UBX5_9ZZZZ|nr:hypothetical protein [Actinomycetota bacterium]